MRSRWKKGWPPVDPVAEADWIERYEIKFTLLAGVWHRLRDEYRTNH